MVKMSLDPVQVMSGQVKELKVGPSANGDSRGSWEGKEEFDQDHLGLTTKPKPVSLPPFLSGMLYIRLCLRRIACKSLCNSLGERSKDPFTVALFSPAPVLLPFSG